MRAQRQADNGARRQAELAKIHLAKKELAMEDDTYRGVIRSVGRAASGSAADLSPLGRARVLEHMRACGWKQRPPRRAGSRRQGGGPQVRKIRALWLELDQLGVLRDSSERALAAWARRMTRRTTPHGQGVDALDWLRPREAAVCIEGLKDWLRRERAARGQ